MQCSSCPRRGPANPKFHDVPHFLPHFLQETFGKQEGELADLLQEVECQHLLVMEASVQWRAAPYQKVAPPRLAPTATGQPENLSHVYLRLWQLGYTKSALAEVTVCFEACLLGGAALATSSPF